MGSEMCIRDRGGQASLTQYETVLRSVTYQNTSDDPSALTRTIDFVVNDGDIDSNLISRNVEITAENDPPVLSTIEVAPAFYTENGSPVAITPSVVVNDLDDTQIQSATAAIRGNFAMGEDVLSFTEQFGITGSFDAVNGAVSYTHLTLPTKA